MRKTNLIRATMFLVAAVVTIFFAIEISKPKNTIEPDGITYKTEQNTSKSEYDEEITLPYDEETSFAGETSHSDEKLTESNTEISKMSDFDTENAEITSKSSFTTGTQSASPTQKETLTQKPETTSKIQNSVPRENSTAPVTTAKITTTTTTAAVKTTTTTTTLRHTDDDSMTVYITRSGKRYHYANPCGNGTYYATTLGEAKEKGLTPCSKCVH